MHPDSVIASRAATSAEGWATLDYDVLDFTLSRRFLMDCPQQVNFTLFGGLRYAKIDQTLGIAYVDSVNSVSAEITNPIKLDAYGIRAGGQLDWNAYGCWSLFARGAVSALAARVDANFRETDVTGTGTTTPVNVSERYYQAVPGIETAFGIAYERNNWELGFGYEMAIWGNVGERRDFVDDVDDQKSTYPSSDLILDGFFLRLAYNR